MTWVLKLPTLEARAAAAAAADVAEGSVPLPGELQAGQTLVPAHCVLHILDLLANVRLVFFETGSPELTAVNKLVSERGHAVAHFLRESWEVHELHKKHV